MPTIREKIDNLRATTASKTEEDIQKQADERDHQIVKTSAIGILANALLAALKAVIGLLSGSIAIVLDAVNNLSDAASSVITIVGTKLARRPADRKHPFGHGRIEYFTATIISVIVLYAGITSLIEAIKKIIHPTVPDYTTVGLTIIAAAVLVKVVLGRYVVKVGKRVNSESLVNSGKDAKLDSVISASTLVAALVYISTGLSLEAWLGAIISAVIIKSGIDMLHDTLSEILGERADAQLAKDINATVTQFPGVSGMYDLVLNNYGPDTYNGSLHIEVPDTFSADQIDELTRNITEEVYRKHHVILTAISVYSINTKNPKIVAMHKEVNRIAMGEPYVLQVHGFHFNEKTQTMRLDIVISFDSPDRAATFRNVEAKLRAAFPHCHIEAIMDTDFALS